MLQTSPRGGQKGPGKKMRGPYVQDFEAFSNRLGSKAELFLALEMLSLISFTTCEGEGPELTVACRVRSEDLGCTACSKSVNDDVQIRSSKILNWMLQGAHQGL